MRAAGMRNGNHKLDPRKVQAVRDSVRAGFTHMAVAKAAQLASSTVSDEQLGRVAIVEKDRTRIAQGAVVKLALGCIYAVFAAIVDATLAGAVEPIATEQRSSGALFAGVTNRGRVKALVGDVKGLLNMHWPSSSAVHTQTRANALYQAFGHSSWPRLERSDEASLTMGLQRLQSLCAAGGPTTTASPTPEHIVTTIRKALSNDPGDATARAKALAVGRTLGGALPNPHRGEALGIVEATAKRWEQGDVDQRDPWNGDDLPC